MIIVDSSDPVGPAETLFTATFYQRAAAVDEAGQRSCATKVSACGCTST